MATPAEPEYVELVGASSTLLIGSRAIQLVTADDLVSTGPSVGSNIRLGGQDGTEIQPRARGELRAVIGFRIVGVYDQDGAAAADPVANGLTLQRLVKAFPDSEAREFTARLTQFDDVFEGLVSFEEFGPWARPEDALWVGSYIVTIADGELAEVTP